MVRVLKYYLRRVAPRTETPNVRHLVPNENNLEGHSTTITKQTCGPILYKRKHFRHPWCDTRYCIT